MGIKAKIATGKARCKICKEPIKEKEMCIQFYAFRISEHYHQDCINKKVSDKLYELKSVKSNG